MVSIIQKLGRTFLPFHQLSRNVDLQNGLKTFFPRTLFTLRSINPSQPSIDIFAMKSKPLLPLQSINYTQTCGLKHLGKVHRRCRGCHLLLKEGVMYNYCKVHPRHNQKAKTKRPKNTWTMTGVMTTKIRPW